MDPFSLRRPESDKYCYTGICREGEREGTEEKRERQGGQRQVHTNCDLSVVHAALLSLFILDGPRRGGPAKL